MIYILEYVADRAVYVRQRNAVSHYRLACYVLYDCIMACAIHVSWEIM